MYLRIYIESPESYENGSVDNECLYGERKVTLK